MPIDSYFEARSERRKRERAARAARLAIPVCKPGERNVALQMGKDGGDWYHFLDVPESAAKAELTAWRHLNPDFSFRLA